MGGRARILIVDDEPAVLALLAEVFADRGFETETAVSASEALSKVQRLDKFDVALVDKNLPGRSGLDFVRKFKELQPEGEAILITAYPSNDSAEEAYQLGVFDYIVKPFEDVFALIDKVNSALEARGK